MALNNDRCMHSVRRRGLQRPAEDAEKVAAREHSPQPSRCAQHHASLGHRYRLALPRNEGLRMQERALTLEEWMAAEDLVAAAGEDKPPGGCRDEDAFFREIAHRAHTYAALQAAGDEYGLMFHLRSELMRRQVGGAGYERDGSKRLRAERRTRQHAAPARRSPILRPLAHSTAPLAVCGGGCMRCSSHQSESLGVSGRA